MTTTSLFLLVITVGDFTNLPRLKHESKVYKVLSGVATTILLRKKGVGLSSMECQV
jgi:hypothetical protein